MPPSPAMWATWLPVSGPCGALLVHAACCMDLVSQHLLLFVASAWHCRLPGIPAFPIRCHSSCHSSCQSLHDTVSGAADADTIFAREIGVDLRITWCVLGTGLPQGVQPIALCAVRDGCPFVQRVPVPHCPPTTWQQSARPSKRPRRSGVCLLCHSPAGSSRCKCSPLPLLPWWLNRMGIYQDASTDPWPTLKPLPGVSGSLNLNTTEGLYFLASACQKCQRAQHANFLGSRVHGRQVCSRQFVSQV